MIVTLQTPWWMSPELLPDLRRLVGDRRPIIVYDRVGWSPQFFAELVAVGLDFLTYREDPFRPERPARFQEQHFECDDMTHSYSMADRWVRLPLGQRRKGEPKTSRVRHVTRLTPNGHLT